MIRVASARSLDLHVFPTQLGWMAALTVDGQLAQLAFGGESPQSVSQRLNLELLSQAAARRRRPAWIRLLQQYADGKRVDLSEIPLALSPTLTHFQRSVLQLCREIPYGGVATYGQVATQAGYPRAARAVGNVMAANCVPIVVPCHRVVPAGGKLGRYSAPGGVRTKLRLLEMEGGDYSSLRNANAELVSG